MKRFFLVLLLLLPISVISRGEGFNSATPKLGSLRSSGLPTGGGPVTVPLKLTYAGLTAEVEINGRTVELVLDTGAGSTILSPALARELGLDVAPGGEDSVVSSTGDHIDLRLALTRRMVLSGAWTEREPVVIAEMPPTVAGLLGLSTLADWDVRIEPAEKKLILFPAGKAPAMEGETVLPLTCELAGPVASLKNSQSYRCINLRVPVRAAGRVISAIPDTGGGGLLQLPTSFFEEQAPDVLKNALPALRVAVSMTGGVTGRVAKLPELIFGPDTIRDISTNVVNIPRDSPLGQFALVGFGLLRHYVMTFRFSAGELRLKPLGTVQEVVKTSTAGIFMEYTPEGRNLISDVVPDGPAAIAGLRKGDEFLEIEGHPLKTMKPEEFAAFKRLPPGSAVKVRYRRGMEAPVEAVLVLVKK
jgi:hypothetical protein